MTSDDTLSARVPLDRSAKRSHAVLDIESRIEKARLIGSLIKQIVGDTERLDVLEIGTGSGYIAEYIAARSGSFVSVDVVDERKVQGFRFQVVRSELLPFADAKFDLVISNHVVEHVDDQLLHLQEIRRVLHPAGACYFSTPNKWTIIEPHFRLPFLSWLPESMRHDYVRRAGKGTRFDVQPLSLSDIQRLSNEAGLSCEEVSDHMVIERMKDRFPIPANLVRALWPLLRPLSPTFVSILRSRP